jgi:hypothetical protein
MSTDAEEMVLGGEDLVFGKNAVRAIIETLPGNCSMVFLSEKTPPR